jgi:hypothetical protein
LKKNRNKFEKKNRNKFGDWGIGDWGLGIGPIPNPQSPTLIYFSKKI